jgi:adenylate kinase
MLKLFFMSELKKKILFLGPAGSGKGTQSARLAQKYNLAHISTGDLIRAEIKSGSDLGNKVKSLVEAGELVSDDIVNEIVKSNVTHLEAFILDGYPRTLEQAKFFDEVAKFDFVFDLQVPRDLLFERLTGRRMCSKTSDANCNAVFHLSFNPPTKEGICDKCGSDLYQRKDDTQEAIEKRLSGYEAETGRPLTEFYKTQLVKIDGNQSADEVFASIESQILSIH